ncbi:hypothetical protein D3C77_366350 [compost metagenome]
MTLNKGYTGPLVLLLSKIRSPARWPGSSHQRLSSDRGVCSSASGVTRSAEPSQLSGRSLSGFFNGSYLLGSSGSSVGSSVPGSGFDGTEPCAWSSKLESVDIRTSPMRSSLSGPYWFEAIGFVACIRVDERAIKSPTPSRIGGSAKRIRLQQHPQLGAMCVV